MELKSKATRHFKKGQSYLVEDTVGFPAEYFRKPKTIKEDPQRKYTSLKEGDSDDLSGLDVCVKSFKIETKWYE